ncbi:MAG TPA: exonuclease SbcCD subunit D C-terminal domain-containing protein [Anaeromyxobacteraceae bacterium]|nr:exonuclease SbcCD subunit D C-terminal domain-containing protein [Anaeromyxobacteraceae bacterium]
MSLRLLHTSDWHLGHILHGFERAREHALVLDWLLATIEKESVDALLVAGDIFDSANPSTEAQQLWYRFLVDAWRRVPHLQVVVIGGNHDSPSRLDSIDPFLRALGRLHVVGGAARNGSAIDVDRHVVPLFDRTGKRTAWVAAVPHLRATETGTGDEAAVAFGIRKFYDQVLARIRAQRSDEAIVAMGHLHLVGGQVSSISERRLSVGNEAAIGCDLFPPDVAYVALGHLHLAQAVGGRDHIRYSGSLIPLALSERTYPHQVVLVVLDGTRASEIRPLSAPRLIELPRIPPTGTATVDEALCEIRALPPRTPAAGVGWPLLEVEVRLERPEPSLRQKLEEALQGKAARLARLGVTMTGTGAVLGGVEVRTISDLTPEEVFRAKWARHHKGEPPPDLLRTFQELIQMVHEDIA